MTKKQIVAGVDIGGTNTVFGLVDKNGKVLSEGRFLTSDYPDINDYVKVLSSGILNLTKTVKDWDLTGIGIGAPNANYNRGTVEHAVNLSWHGIIPLGEMIKQQTGVSVVLTNDANAAAMGEMIFGSAKNMKDFIVLTLGTGLGSGIVINGKMVYGHTGFAGELGHMTIVPQGRECGCGRKGCLETYASASGLVRTVSEILAEMRTDSALRKMAIAEITSKKIAELAADNDPVAVRAMNRTAEYLGFGIINAIVFSSPEAIFLSGGLAQAGDLLFKPVRKYLEGNNLIMFRDTVKILPSGIPEANGAVLGAAALILNELK